MKLLEPGRLGALTLKNRVIMAPMGIRGLVDPDGDFGERVRAYYEARARGGVGMITTEMVFVTRALEPVSKLLFTLESDKHADSLRALADRLHAYDCKLSVQLTAGFGRVVPAPVVEEGVPPVSASENTNFYVPDFPDYNSRAMTAEETEALGRSFGFAARRVREAGADCVELHGHEGYLLDQFMTALWNRRTDRYGGTRENRLRLVREAIASIQKEAGKDFPIIFRYALTHHLEGGREEAEGLWLAKAFEEMGVAALHVDAGCYETSWWPHPPSYQPPGCMVDLAEKVKAVTSLPVISVGRLQYPDVAEEVLVQGKADFIAIGRGLLSDPDWVNKVAAGKKEEILPCLGCHEGCLWQMIAGEPTSCSVRPLTGHETDWQPARLKAKRRLLVVGGGPAGIEAARVGAERGFDVTLWEGAERLGGALHPASKPWFKRDIADYLEYLKGLAARLPIDVVLGKRADRDAVLAFGADHAIVATGAEMEPPPLGGDRVMTAVDVLLGRDPEGKRIVVQGGGVIACETAIYLSRKGKEVALLSREDSDDLDMSDFYDHNNRLMLLRMLKEAKVAVLRGAIPVALKSGSVVAEQGGAQIEIPLDSLVFAGRRFPVNALGRSLEDRPNVVSVGDCREPGRIMEAVWGAFHAVREIESGS